MKYEKYDVEASESFLRFEFLSVGPKSVIKKAVEYESMKEFPGVFNLLFGDLDEHGEIDDKIVSNNGDGVKVLATVASTIEKFFLIYPDNFIFLTGRTFSRIRLYRMAISNNKDEFKGKLFFFGRVKDKWRPIKRNVNYNSFLIAKKNHTFAK